MELRSLLVDFFAQEFAEISNDELSEILAAEVTNEAKSSVKAESEMEVSIWIEGKN